MKLRKEKVMDAAKWTLPMRGALAGALGLAAALAATSCGGDISLPDSFSSSSSGEPSSSTEQSSSSAVSSSSVQTATSSSFTAGISSAAFIQKDDNTRFPLGDKL